MDLKTRAIVLKSVLSGDKDMLITIFCLDYGILKAKLKGVKGPKAKLKFATQPFCFADFVLSEKNGFYTVTQADVIDTFYSLTSNYDDFLEASKIIKYVLKISPLNQPNNALFLNMLKSIKALTYDKVQSNIVLIKFLLGVFFSEGYSFSHTGCSSCGQKLGTDIFLDFDTGQVLCFSCKTPYSQKISFEINSVLRVVNSTYFDGLSSLELDTFNVENATLLLEKVFENKF